MVKFGKMQENIDFLNFLSDYSYFPSFTNFFCILPSFSFLPFSSPNSICFSSYSIALLVLSSIPAGLCRNGHLPHDVACEGWLQVCRGLKGDTVGPSRVGADVVIDCLGAFATPETDDDDDDCDDEIGENPHYAWVVEEWILATNRTRHFVDERSRLHLGE